jgi:superoxide dismutase, Fe-Mn family
MRALTKTRQFAFSTKMAKLPDLEYDYGELQPVISPRLLEFHHKKHHQAYVNNYNLALEKLEGIYINNKYI